MDRTFPFTPGPDLLQRLTQFIGEVGQITSLPVLADRILSEFCQTTQQPNGSLYLQEHGHEYFRCLTVYGQLHKESLPHIVGPDHPFVRHLAAHQQTLEPSLNKCGPRPTISGTAPSCEIESWRSNMTIPLATKGRLVGFVILWSQHELTPPNLEGTNILAAMAQIAASTLIATLLQNEHLHLEPLRCRTDRLRTLELMAEGFAHAIRNPLTSIKTFIQLASERKDDGTFMRDFSQMAIDDVSRLEQRTQEMLDYARYAQPQLTNEDVNEIVSSCLSLLEFRSERRRIKIEKELAPELPRGMVDRQHMQHALLSLLFDALDAHTHTGGTLRVRTNTFTRPDGDIWSQILIEDAGQGLPSKPLEQIENPHSATSPLSGDQERTGVGLTIAQQIIRAHRGEIHIQRTEGVGTLCSINLPSLAA